MSEERPQGERASRRTFLRGAGVGAGATVLGVAASSAGSASASTEASGSATSAGAASKDAGYPAALVQDGLVAYISDFKGGTISLLFGNREVVFRDHSLVRALAAKAR